MIDEDEDGGVGKRGLAAMRRKKELEKKEEEEEEDDNPDEVKLKPLFKF